MIRRAGSGNHDVPDIRIVRGASVGKVGLLGAEDNLVLGKIEIFYKTLKDDLRYFPEFSMRIGTRLACDCSVRVRNSSLLANIEWQRVLTEPEPLNCGSNECL